MFARPEARADRTPAPQRRLSLGWERRVRRAGEVGVKIEEPNPVDRVEDSVAREVGEYLRGTGRRRREPSRSDGSAPPNPSGCEERSKLK